MTLTLLAKSVKSLDESLWSIKRDSEEYDIVHSARQKLVSIIFENGYELQSDSYRLIKSKVNRSVTD